MGAQTTTAQDGLRFRNRRALFFFLRCVRNCALCIYAF
jgi:hypothetical protein